MGKILFLSAVAFIAYRYIGRSNRKAREIAQKEGEVQILPPERSTTFPPGAATEYLPAAKSPPRVSEAVETELRR